MLISLNRMVGMPVIWWGENVGSVERAIPDVESGRLDGLVVRRGIGWARWAAGENVILVGEKCVILAKKPEHMPQRAKGDMLRVFLTTGECAGEVADVIIHGDSLALAALEICQGPFCRLIGKRGYAAEFHRNANGEIGEIVIPHLLSWTQLVKQLGEEDEK